MPTANPYDPKTSPHIQGQDLIPHRHRLVVVPDPPEAEIGNVVIPDAWQHQDSRGTVLAVGELVATGYGIQPGDVVRYSEYTGVPLTLHGQRRIILHLEDLWGVETDSDEWPD